MEFSVLVRKAVEEVAGLETGPAIMPDAFLRTGRVREPAGFNVCSIISGAVISKAGCEAPRRLARADCTPWLDWHSA